MLERRNPFESPTTVGDPTVSNTVNRSFGATAAQLSWQLPLAAVIVSIVGRAVLRDQSAVFGGLLIVLSIVGLLAGITAWLSIVLFGWRRILVPATVGVLLNSGLLYLFINAMLALQKLKQG